MAWLNLIFSKAGGYLAAGIALAVGILTALSKAKQSGRDEVVAKSAKKEIENVTTANKVSEDVSHAPADDVQQRLRDKWSRD